MLSATTNDTPLIWTTLGNVPVDSLVYRHEWIENDNDLRLVETYTKDGEIVKQNVHIKIKRGLAAVGEQGLFGG